LACFESYVPWIGTDVMGLPVLSDIELLFANLLTSGSGTYTYAYSDIGRKKWCLFLSVRRPEYYLSGHGRVVVTYILGFRQRGFTVDPSHVQQHAKHYMQQAHSPITW
jgi:hypothetical protein